MRKISRHMLRRKVRAWGKWGTKLLVVMFTDGKLALVDPRELEYSSIKAWNWSNRYYYIKAAKNKLPKPLPLAALLDQLGYKTGVTGNGRS